MSEADERILRETNMAFFGAVTASLSHEINNVFSIINELSGLLDDYMAAAEQGAPLNPQKLKGIAEKAEKQVQRGKILVKRLNSFAHSSDETVATVGLHELLDRMIAIAQRLAVLKKAELRSELPDEDVELTTNPFLLEQAVFSCIKMSLEALDENRIITVSYEISKSGAVVLVKSADPVHETEEGKAERSVLALLMSELGGTVEYVPGPDACFSFKLVVPRSIPGANA